MKSELYHSIDTWEATVTSPFMRQTIVQFEDPEDITKEQETTPSDDEQTRQVMDCYSLQTERRQPQENWRNMDTDEEPTSEEEYETTDVGDEDEEVLKSSTETEDVLVCTEDELLCADMELICAEDEIQEYGKKNDETRNDEKVPNQQATLNDELLTNYQKWRDKREVQWSELENT